MLQLDFDKIEQKTNKAFIPFLKCKTRFQILYGGAGSGKSFVVAQKILLKIFLKKEKTEKQIFYVFRKTRVTLKNSCVALILSILEEWNLSGLFVFNKSDLFIEFFNGDKIIFSGVDNPEKLKSISRMTAAWIEEATELSFEDFSQINLRLRGKSVFSKEIYLSFNPISKLNWIYSYFFEKTQDNIEFFHSNYESNKFLDVAYIEQLKETKRNNPSYFQIYALGKWGVLQGKIYENYEVLDTKNFNSMEFDQESYGIDFGFNNPTAVVFCGVKDQNLYFKELFYERKKTNHFFIEWCSKNLKKNTKAFCDSEDPQRIQEMVLSGIFCAKTKKGPHSVMKGIDFLKRNKLFIEGNSKNLLKEISGYVWRLDRKNEPMEEPLKMNDHLMDSMRYATNNGFKQKEFMLL